MAYENTIEINNSTWTEVPLAKGSYHIEAVDPSTVIEYSLNSNGQDSFTINSGSAQYTLDAPASLYFKASSLFNGKTTKVYINDYSTLAAAPLAAPQAQEINIDNRWTELALGAGSYFIIPESGSLIVSMSLSPTGDNSKALKRGGEQVSLNAPASLYFKLNTEDNRASAVIKYNTINVIASTGSGGGGGGGGGTTYTFNAPLTERNGVVSLNYSSGINVVNGQLVADVAGNSDFQALQLQVTNNESKLNNLEISVQNNEANIVTLQNDVSNNKTAIQNLNTELNNAVKLTGDQTIDGIKTFVASPIVPNPTNDTDVANKLYVDTTIANNTLTFQGALNKTGNDVTIGLENDIVLNGTGDKLTLNLNANSDFKNVLLGLDEAKKIATYTDVGRVMPKQNDFVIDGLTGELSLDITPTGTLKQNFVDLTSQQTVDGEKDFIKEVRANNLTTNENGLGYGSIDVRKADGYYSISRNGTGQAVDILMALGFVDGTTNVRIRNMAGGIVTFNTLVQYDQTFTPTDDKDLVHLAYVRQIREELINLIQSLQGYIHFVGVISNTKQQCEQNMQLLTDFVQAQESRAPRNGDFVKTSDSFGFIYNGTNWINFGQVSISIATTTTAGIMMFGTNAGELEDLGNGKAKVIGWDAVEQALRTLHTNVTSNKSEIDDIRALVNQNITDIGTKANDNAVVKLTGDQTVAGLKTFTSNLKVLKGNPGIELRDSTGNKSSIISTIDNGDNIQIAPSSGGSIQFTGKLRYPWNSIPTVTADNEIPALKQIKDTFATITSLNSKANDNVVVKLSGAQTISDIKTFNASPVVPTATADNQAANLGNVKNQIASSCVTLTGDQTISGEKDFEGTIYAKNSNRTIGAIRTYIENDASGLGQPVFQTFGTKTEKQASIGFTDAANQGKFEIKIESLSSRPNPKIALSNNTEIDGTLTVSGDITAPNMPKVLAAGTVPSTTNVGSMQVAFVLKP